MQRRQGREGSGRSGGPSPGRACQEEEDGPHPQVPGRWASRGRPHAQHWRGKPLGVGSSIRHLSLFSHAFILKSQLYRDRIHTPCNSPLRNAQFSGFSFIHQVLRLSPLPNFRTFSSLPERNLTIVSSHSTSVASQTPLTTNRLSVSMDLLILDFSHKWDSVTCGFFNWHPSLCVMPPLNCTVSTLHSSEN